MRTEIDSLGPVQVPDEALWGAQTQRAVENFTISGLRQSGDYIAASALVKQAAAEVNMSLGQLDAERGHAIVRAAREIVTGRWHEHFVVDPFQAGAGTSHHMNTNEVIANLANEALGGARGEYKPVHPNDHVNMAQSTNDVIPTVIRLAASLQIQRLLSVLDSLAAALEEKAVEFDAVLKAGRTHLQDAVPVRLGQEFGAYAAAIRHDHQRIARAAETLQRLGIGGTATVTGLNSDTRYHQAMVDKLSALTGIPFRSSGNLFESMQSTADLLDASAALRTLATTLTRIANDLRLLSSGPTTGLYEIELPSLQPGSSIMPGKVNPVMAEMLDMAMFQVIGCDTTVALAAQAGQLELNVMMPVIAHNLFEMMQVMIGAMAGFTERCVRGVEANRARAESWLAHNPIVATALNPLIGYRAAAELVKEARARDLPIRAVAVEKAAAGMLRRSDAEARLVTVAEVEAALSDLSRLTRGGIQGTPAGG
jgi:aspartate ammonia-lyase